MSHLHATHTSTQVAFDTGIKAPWKRRMCLARLITNDGRIPSTPDCRRFRQLGSRWMKLFRCESHKSLGGRQDTGPGSERTWDFDNSLTTINGSVRSRGEVFLRFRSNFKIFPTAPKRREGGKEGRKEERKEEKERMEESRSVLFQRLNQLLSKVLASRAAFFFKFLREP